jgi:hypothetical protein
MRAWASALDTQAPIRASSANGARYASPAWSEAEGWVSDVHTHRGLKARDRVLLVYAGASA